MILRGHGIPFPYLISYSISFLAYLPPVAYLTLLSSGSDPSPSESNFLDIPTMRVRNLVRRDNIREQLSIILATLEHDPSTPSKPRPGSNFANPAFPLLSEVDSPILENALSHTFPNSNLERIEEGRWTLSFGEAVLILSRSRMARLASVIGIVSEHPGFIFGGSTGPTWLDLVVSFFMLLDDTIGLLDPQINGQTSQASSMYSSIYTTPEGVQLVNTLSSINEPGFALGKVPVRSLSEVFAIIEVSFPF